MIRKPDDRMVLLSMDLQIRHCISYLSILVTWVIPELRKGTQGKRRWCQQLRSCSLPPSAPLPHRNPSLPSRQGRGKWLILAILSSSLPITHLLKLILYPNISHSCPFLLSSSLHPANTLEKPPPSLTRLPQQHPGWSPCFQAVPSPIRVFLQQH